MNRSITPSSSRRGFAAKLAGAISGVLVAAVMVAGPAGAERPRGPAGLSNGRPTPTHGKIPCNGVEYCNYLIAYCFANGGDWVETQHTPSGQPSKGYCYV